MKYVTVRLLGFIAILAILTQIGMAQVATVNLEAGPIWDQADAETKCSALASQNNGVWTGNWLTTVEGAMSVCNISKMRPFAADIEAGPIWDQADAEAKCSMLANEQGGVWTGGWLTTVESEMSVCNVSYPVMVDLEAGPIWDQADANAKCPALANERGGVWTGGWVTTVEGQMSVCNIAMSNPFSADLEAGPLWNQSDAEAKCPALAREKGGLWTGGWVTTVESAMSVCNISFPGPIAGIKDVVWGVRGFGDMTFDGDMGQVRGNYNTDNGVVIGEFNGLTFSGKWIEDHASQACNTTVDGRNYWGNIEMVFNSDLTGLEGKWGYCEETVNRSFTGARK